MLLQWMGRVFEEDPTVRALGDVEDPNRFSKLKPPPNLWSGLFTEERSLNDMEWDGGTSEGAFERHVWGTTAAEEARFRARWGGKSTIEAERFKSRTHLGHESFW